MYGLIQREIKIGGLDVTYEQAVAKDPVRIESILKIISILSLATRTKLILKILPEVLSEKDITDIYNVCLAAYKLKLKLINKKKKDPSRCHPDFIFDQGICHTSGFTYKDYLTKHKVHFSERTGNIR